MPLDSPGDVCCITREDGRIFAFLLGVWPDKGRVTFLGIRRTFGTPNDSIQGLQWTEGEKVPRLFL